MTTENIKQLPISYILVSSFNFFNSKPMAMLAFSLLNYAIIMIGIYTWSTPAFLLLAMFAYAFWSYFFRFYFAKKPYFQSKQMISSLAPSTKILVIGFVVLTILIVLPFAPLFLGVFSAPQADAYLQFLKTYMQDSQALDTFLGIITVFVAPYILFRPMFAWIGSLIGRNGTLKFAFSKTTGNYWKIVAILLIINIPFVIVEHISNALDFNLYLKFLPISPLIIYSNLVIAKAYSFFFIED